MKRLLLAALLCVTGCGEPATGPVPIAFGEDGCDGCRMIISEAPSAAQARFADGRVEKFDDIGCLATRLAAGPEPLEAWVTDAATAKWIDARTAHYVRSPGLKTPMGWGLAAFAARADAEALAGKSGARVMGFEELGNLPRPR